MSEKQVSTKPFVPADKAMPEFTPTAIILGIILAVVFGAANAYLGLRVGMTISASIPAAVISMGVIRVIMRKDSILENNMVQTIGSAGESLACGAIFTLPAIFLWAQEGKVARPSALLIGLICLVGGLLGVLFMVPLRQALIVEENGKLPFPEGQACAEVLLAGEEGGSKAGIVFSGLGVAAVYKFLTDGLKIWPSEVGHDIKFFKGSSLGLQPLPALAGVGYICGTKISSYMFAGGVMSWFVLMPIISLFGAHGVVFPGTAPISGLAPQELWGTYVRYIGAGAVAGGGIISLIKSAPLIGKTFKQTMQGFGRSGKAQQVNVLRTDKNLSMKFIIPAIIAIVLVIWLVPVFPVNFLGAVCIVIFGFFFAAVSSRMVGIIGSSNNPVSGMAIATLIITTLLLKATGTVGAAGMVGAIAITGIICSIAAIAGDTSQDLKTGFIVGATPKKQQIGEMIGVVAASSVIGYIMLLLNNAWGFGSDEIPAPQAMMMKLIVEGIMTGKLPWALILTGIAIAIVVEILGIPVMPFAVGMYLPLSLSAGIMCGGIVRWIVDRSLRKKDEKAQKNAKERGTLYTSGLIAGEGIMGIILAAVAAGGKDLDVSSHFSLGQIGSLVLWVAMLGGLAWVCLGKHFQKKDAEITYDSQEK